MVSSPMCRSWHGRLLLGLVFGVALSPRALSHGYLTGRQPPVYDVEVIMRRIQCIKVVEGPFDDADDIYGQFLFGGYSYNRTIGGTLVKGCCLDGARDDAKPEFLFFDRPRDRAVSLTGGRYGRYKRAGR